ncbi:MAG: universal stress protein [Rhodospirillales bacterium]
MYRQILLAVDLNEESSWRKALPTSIEYCRAFAATLHLIAVAPNVGMPLVGQFFPDDYEKQVEDAVLEALRAFVAEYVPDDICVQRIVSQGTIYQEIIAAANTIGADLIVIAAHRPELRDYLLGPNAARVVRHAACSVLVVRE